MDGLIQTLGNVARVKKSAQNHSPSARVRALFLTLAKFPRASVGRDDNRPTNSALTFKELSLKLGILKSLRIFLRIFLIKCFQFLVLRNKVKKLKNSKKGEKTLFATM
jgi:hypothetical protein